MKALVKYQKGQGNMEVRDIPEPSPGQYQVKIEVRAAGICGSDLHIYHDDIAIPVRPPVVIGHEFSGVIHEIGEGVTEWKPGDRVVSEAGFEFCGHCEYCNSGFANLCSERKSVGYWYDGAFTNYTIVPAARVHRLPENVDFIEGALMEPLACVVHGAMESTDINTGDVVLVTGPGAIGLLAVQIAKAQGATVIVSGTAQDTERLQLAAEFGADLCINLAEQQLPDRINQMTEHRGVDVVLECSGNERAVRDALDVIKKRGQYTQIGLFGKAISLDFETICFKELKVTGAIASNWSSWRKALQLVSQQKVRLRPLVSESFPLTEWQKAFDMFEKKQGLKLLLSPIQS